MNNPLFVSFYTLETEYQQVMYKYLFPSIQKHNLDYVIEGVHSKGTWLKNAALKPTVLKQIFKSDFNKHDSYVLLDADSTIEKYPQLFFDIPLEYDMAVHYLDFAKWYQREGAKKELLSGTLFIRNNAKTKKLINEWEHISSTEDKWEQKVLQDLLITHTDIKVYELPLEYCYIATMSDGSEPIIKCDAVIKHHQVSRVLKRVINASNEKR
jgi:hypothetical protein